MYVRISDFEQNQKIPTGYKKSSAAHRLRNTVLENALDKLFIWKKKLL